MEKLGQLRGATGEWDLIVVDTPPSRSALDFLDAPHRLGSFLDGRLIRILLGAGEGRRRSARSSCWPAGCRPGHRGAEQDPRLDAAERRAVVRRRAGHDVRRFPRARRARRTSCCRPRAPRSWWSPRPSRTRCARPRTSPSGWPPRTMPLAGLVLNRVHRSRSRTSPPSARWPPPRSWTATRRRRAPGRRAAAAARRRCGSAARERRLAERFTASHPGWPVAEVPAQPGDVHDLDGLRPAGDLLAGGGEAG